ncbi:MAG: hypothetical protein ACM3UO_00020 [Bacillota bacterium]
MTTRLRTSAAWTLIGLSVTGLLAVMAGGAATAATGTGTSSTAVTVSGTGEFSGVNVTVSQTQGLVNQVVRVSWTGAQQTAPLQGSFSNNFMQVMQCWGDGPKPLRQDCQFGAYSNDPRGGPEVASRQVNQGVNLVDPEETIVPSSPTQNVSVPFVSVHGDSTTAFPNPYFDANTTNEQPFGRTSADGTGQVFFEVQTAAQAPGLGCGAPEADGSPRSCWLVVVPRGTREVNGTQPQQLISSPLSQSNWDHAIAIRIHFRPLAATCPIGAAERRLIGQEEVTEAISSWQSVLCQKTGSIFGFSQVSDDIARSQTLTSDPWMSMVTAPLDPSKVTDGRKLVYAPISLDGVGIAFNIDQSPKYGAPPSAVALAGQRLRTLKLNARLVAKLLTQSYRQASFASNFPLHNPDDLTRDPEFQALNPGLNSMFFDGIYQIIVPEGLSDAYRELWNWVMSDQEARSFMAGAPDPWGTVINPAYKNMGTAINNFPRLDLACRPVGGGVGPQCPFDRLAYAQDLHGGTRAASRGDLLSRTVWDLTSQPPMYKDGPLELSGSRAILTLTETATAARYSLPMAELENADAQFVAPTSDSLTHGYEAMVPTGIGNTLAPNPGSFDPAAYPLTHITYALTAPDRLATTEATAYSRFLRYAAGDGQVSGIDAGNLPPGYVPLPESLRQQTLAVANQVAAGPSSNGSGSKSSTPSSPAPASSGSASSVPVKPISAGVLPTKVGATKATPVSAPLMTKAFTTPQDDLGNSRFALILALSFGLVAGVAWLVIPLMARRGPPAS